MIEINNVHMSYPKEKRYVDYLLHPFKRDTHLALKGIDLKIDSGDRIAFLGANGAGKTTLLKLIGGLLYPTKGNIIIDGYDTISHNMLARKSVGFVLNEERSFYWRLTGKQNLQFFGKLDNLEGNKLKTKIDEVLYLVELDNDAINRRFAGYSSGMKQRLAIARGLLSDPKILILDEPTRTLDPISAESIKNILEKRLHQNTQRTLLIATHRLEEAEALCNKLCIMNKGNVLLYSNTKEVLTAYKSLHECYKSVINQKETILS